MRGKHTLAALEKQPFTMPEQEIFEALKALREEYPFEFRVVLDVNLMARRLPYSRVRLQAWEPPTIGRLEPLAEHAHEIPITRLFPLPGTVVRLSIRMAITLDRLLSEKEKLLARPQGE